MRTVLIAALTAALVALGIVYFRSEPATPSDPTAAIEGLQREIDDLRTTVTRRPINIVVVLTQAGARCKSQSLPHEYAYPQQAVRWFILNVNCNLNGGEVEIRFADGNTPLDVKLPKHVSFIQTKVRNDATPGSYKYALWAVGKAGDYMLEDPELEIGDF